MVRAASALLLLPAAAFAQGIDCDAVIHETRSGDPVHVQLRLESPLRGARELHLDSPCEAPVRGIASAVGIPALLDFHLIIDGSGSTDASSGVDDDGDGTIGGAPDSIHAAEIAAARAFVDSVDLAFSRVALVRFASSAVLQVPPSGSRACGRAATPTTPRRRGSSATASVASATPPTSRWRCC